MVERWLNLRGVFHFCLFLKEFTKSQYSSLSTKSETVEDRGFTIFFEDGTKVKIPSEIKPFLYSSFKGFYLKEEKLINLKLQNYQNKNKIRLPTKSGP